MKRCEAIEDAIADVSVSGGDTLVRHGGEAVFNSWQLEGLEAVIVYYILLILQNIGNRIVELNIILH